MLIEEHHTELYPSKLIIPKMHFMVHFPQQILDYGLHGHQIQIDEVEAQVQQIPDSVVDRSTDVFKTYFSPGAWKTVAETSERDYQMAVLSSCNTS